MKIKKALLGILLVGAVVTLAACGKTLSTSSSSSNKPSAQATSFSPDVKAGGQIFVDYSCVKCHNYQGKGGIIDPVRNKAIPALKAKEAKSLKSILTNGIIVSKGKENGWINMPNWRGILSDQQINQLTAYFKAGLPNIGAKPLPDTTGPEIYTAYACVKCHGDYGKGGIVDQVYPASSGDHFVPTLDQGGYAKDNGVKYAKKLMNGSIPHHGVATGYPGTLFMPAWGQLMNKTQLQAIENYLKTGK